MAHGISDVTLRSRMRQSIETALILILAQSVRPAFAQLAENKTLTLAAAQKMVAAAQLEAERNHLAGVIAVVDDGGWPILVLRMDRAAFCCKRGACAGKGAYRGPLQEAEPGVGRRYQSRYRSRNYT
jgi:glc operon protein GlcG